jgi:hypothetical protein
VWTKQAVIGLLGWSLTVTPWDGLVLPGYQQDDWVRTQNYAGREWRDLVAFWLAYNRSPRTNPGRALKSPSLSVGQGHAP